MLSLSGAFRMAKSLVSIAAQPAADVLGLASSLTGSLRDVTTSEQDLTLRMPPRLRPPRVVPWDSCLRAYDHRDAAGQAAMRDCHGILESELFVAQFRLQSHTTMVLLTTQRVIAVVAGAGGSGHSIQGAMVTARIRFVSASGAETILVGIRDSSESGHQSRGTSQNQIQVGDAIRITTRGTEHGVVQHTWWLRCSSPEAARRCAWEMKSLLREMMFGVRLPAFP
jgi:hypothetical protein